MQESSNQPVLEITKGADAGRDFNVTGKKVLIGRDPVCELCLSDGQVSRQHAAMVCDGTRWEIEDLKSRNGTLVNGELVTRRTLLDGDVVMLGDTLLVFHHSLSVDRTVLLDEESNETQTITLDEGALFSQWRDLESVESLQRARTDLEALYRVGRMISSMLDTQQLIPRILEVIFAEIKRVDRGSVYLVDAKTNRLVGKASRQRESGAARDHGVISMTMAEQVLREKRAVLTFDAMEDSRFRAGDSIQMHKIRSAICVPLQSQENVLGVIYADAIRTEHRFTRDDLRLLAAIGLQAGSAIENARLYEKLAYEKAALHVANQKLKSAQATLVQSAKLAAVGRLASGLAHDIKNPLAVVMGYAGLIRSRLKRDHPKVLEDLELAKPLADIEEGVQHCNEVIAQLLQFARPSNLAREPMDVNELLAEVLQFMNHELTRAEVEVNRELADSLPPILADRSQLKQVFLNIGLNAIQAMDKSERLLQVSSELVSDGDRKGIRVKLQDNGMGMSEEEREKVFEPFFTTKEEGSGTGLGLSVSYGIVERHGGTLDVLSEQKQGTTFIVTLPIESGAN